MDEDASVGGASEGRHLAVSDPRLVTLHIKRKAQLSKIPRDIWEIVASFLTPADQACLAMASKMIFSKLGSSTLLMLDLPENKVEKLKFLLYLDGKLPQHLLCSICAVYHRRRQPGFEKLPTPSSSNPPVLCPAATILRPVPRTRLTQTRTLPFSFVQLVLRAHRYGSAYGIPVERLSREWKESGSGGQPQWRHSTRYLVAKNGHLFLRVRSSTFVRSGLPPAGMRQLLYEREEYTPYFSICAHWADGELMKVCKCALSHVPEHRPVGVIGNLSKGPHALARSLVPPTSRAETRECSFCQSARRCPQCPSEYLVKINLVEDRHTTDQLTRFKHALVVTRWVDLGDGSGPGLSVEWDAINGSFEGYDSIGQVGSRSLIGIFESEASISVPGVGLVNMNPDKHAGGKDRD